MRRILVRVSALLLFGYGMWLAVSVSVANAFASAAPQIALSVRPDHAAANSRMAELTLTGGLAPQRLAAAEQLARRALRRDPTQTRAYSVLGLVSAARGREAAAERLMMEVQRWTRRDLTNQLYLIEMYVARNDVPAALDHYRIALTIRPDVKEVLFPVLIGAVREPNLVRPISEFVASPSPWQHELLFRIAQEGAPLANVDQLFRLVRRKSGSVESDVVRILLDRLVSQGAYGLAARQAALANGGRLPTVRNAGFSSTPQLAPFDWALANSASATADISGGGGLSFEYSSADAAMLARQLLVLPAGAYRLTSRFQVRANEGPDDGLAWSLRCAGGGELVKLPLRGPDARVVGFRVPSGCRAQWLELGTQRESGTQWTSGVVRSVSIEPQAEN